MAYVLISNNFTTDKYTENANRENKSRSFRYEIGQSSPI